MHVLNLAGEWKLRGEFMDIGPERFTEVLEKIRNESEPFSVNMEKEPNVFPGKTGSIPIQIPGDVIPALVRQGILDEPFLKENTKKCLWVRDLSWWFVKDFEVSPELMDQDVVKLYIEMLDFKADIIINGKPVACHENSFCCFFEDVKRFLIVGKNTLLIRLTSGIELNYPKDRISYYCGSTSAVCDQRIYLRKPQFTYGWDWCQPVPTCGIGRAIYLEGFSGAKVSQSRVDTLYLEGEDAEVQFLFEIDKTIMTASEDAVLEYELLFEDQPVYTAKEELLLVGGINYYEKKAKIKKAELWWPNGYGKQNLYTLKSRCICRGSMIETKEKHIGIRMIEIDHSKMEDQTRNFFFCVNGVRIFCKGGNWVPTDSIYLRTPESSYRILVDEAKEAGFTMLRMWGGGTYEPACFYEFCSENGILLMHDFMYACAFYPDHIDSFLYEARREADFQTKRLAHYPCMAVWAGNNEIHESITDWFPPSIAPDRFYGEKIFNYMLPEVVKHNSPMIPYMPSSPYFGSKANQTDDGDVHAWSYLTRREDTKFRFSYELEAFDRMPARFSSEYGFFGAQMESTVQKYMDGEMLSFENEIWKHHGEFERKWEGTFGAIDNHLTDSSKLNEQEYLLYSGVMQGCLYADLAESMRRKSYGSGNLIWMYNDCWPETGWTIIDYYLTRKISFYFLKRAFAVKKLIIRQDEAGAEITVMNESPEEISTEISYGYMDFYGKMESVKKKLVQIKPHSWQQFMVELDGDLGKGFYFASADASGFDTADSLRAYYRNYEFPDAKPVILSAVKEQDDYIIKVLSDDYIPVTVLKTMDDRVHYSDNYFTLYPKQEKTIRIQNCSEKPEIFALKMKPGENLK